MPATSAGSAAPAGSVARVATMPEAAAAAVPADGVRLHPAVWVTGLVAIVGAMLWAFTHHGGGR